jgi:hypothetical protein
MVQHGAVTGRHLIMNREEKGRSQGLKPAFLAVWNGSAEAEPLQDRL